MKLSKIILAILALCSISVLSLSCGSESSEGMEYQLVTVQRGDLVIDITGVGNLVLSYKENLAFELSGTVEEVLVEEGDIVEEGQVLIRLDMSQWQDELTALERQLKAKKLDLLQVLMNVTDAELALEKAIEPYSRDDINNAREAVGLAEDSLEDAQEKLDEAEDSGDEELILQRREEVLSAKEKLLSAEAKLEAMLDAPNLEEVAIKQLQVELAQGRLEDARKAVEDAEEALNEALEASPEIIAPFDGFITKVNVEGGDEVTKGTVAVVIADPAKFEADILVNEMDIFQVKLGGEALVQVDALQGLSLPAEVTHISPTATIQQGVVNYNVKVEVQSLETVMQERQETMPDISSGELPERLRQAIEEGQITQEQAEEMMRQGQQEQEGQQEMPTMLPEDFQLKQGLTVTVSIIMDERNDVLLVPNAAITTQRGQTYVQVVTPDDTFEEREIQTGISDWQYTEVISGLSEGEQVVVPQGTATTPETQQRQPGGMFIPGMGRP